MPRKLDEKVINSRIKENTQVMKNSKKLLVDDLNKVVKNKGSLSDVDVKVMRKNLTAFINACTAISKDVVKLEMVNTAKTDDEKED